MTGANTLTIGGLAISLAVLALNIRGWWKGGKSPKDLIPFVASAAVGALWTACVGGILGWTGGLIAGGTNMAGGGAITRGTGTEDGVIAPGAVASLTPGGAVVVLVATAAWAVVLKAANKTDRRRMLGGLLCGVTLTLTAGAVTVANEAVIPLANMPGDALVAWFGGAA